MAVDNFNKQMEGLTTALAVGSRTLFPSLPNCQVQVDPKMTALWFSQNAKKQLSLRLDSVSKTVNETAALTGIVKDEVCLKIFEIPVNKP